MKAPYHRWLVYLTATGSDYRSIELLCKTHHFMPPEREYLLGLLADAQRALRVRKGEGAVQVHKQRQTYLREQRCLGLLDGNPRGQAARNVLTAPRLRRIVDTLLLTGSSPEHVADLASNAFKLPVTTEAVAFYANYFWDCSLLSHLDWYAYLAPHPSGPFLRACLNRGEEHALWKLGHRTTVVPKATLNTICHESYMRFQELGSWANGQDTALAAKLWAGNVFTALERMAVGADGERSAMEEVRKLTVKLGRREISSLETLRGEDKEQTK